MDTGWVIVIFISILTAIALAPLLLVFFRNLNKESRKDWAKHKSVSASSYYPMGWGSFEDFKAFLTSVEWKKPSSDYYDPDNCRMISVDRQSRIDGNLFVFEGNCMVMKNRSELELAKIYTRQFIKKEFFEPKMTFRELVFGHEHAPVLPSAKEEPSEVYVLQGESYNLEKLGPLSKRNSYDTGLIQFSMNNPEESSELEEILNDPSLSREQKKRKIDRLFREIKIDSPLVFHKN